MTQSAVKKTTKIRVTDLVVQLCTVKFPHGWALKQDKPLFGFVCRLLWVSGVHFTIIFSILISERWSISIFIPVQNKVNDFFTILICLLVNFCDPVHTQKQTEFAEFVRGWHRKVCHCQRFIYKKKNKIWRTFLRHFWYPSPQLGLHIGGYCLVVEGYFRTYFLLSSLPFQVGNV